MSLWDYLTTAYKLKKINNLEKAMNWSDKMKWLPNILKLLALAVALFQPAIAHGVTQWAANNPDSALSLGTMLLVLTNLLPSPVADKSKKDNLLPMILLPVLLGIGLMCPTSAHAQDVVSTPVSAPSPIPSPAAKYTGLIGASFDTVTNRPAGGAGLLTDLGDNVYSFTLLGVTGNNVDNKATYALTQGILYRVQQSSTVGLYVGANAGVQQTDTATTAVYQPVGGVATLRFKPTLELFGGVFLNKDPATGLGPKFLIGLHFGK